MKKIILKAENLHYSYTKEHEALKGVSLDIYEGERLAILGANGSGKSTFFLNINGVLKPNSGNVYYMDKLIDKTSIKELRKNVGIVFQDADNQIIASTVRAEVSFGPINLGLSKEEVEKRVLDSLNYMNISHLIDRPPHYLSGGEKKRVSIADIIAMDSQIIIFDEPTASLDPKNTAIFEEVIDKLNRDRKTLVISTHDLEFAFRWADRIVVFCDGNIIADSDPIDVFSNKEVLRRANLKKPILLEVFEILGQNSVFKANDIAARNIDEFREKFISQVKDLS
ncbi:energy-coupling factor ABC transporter ATP-binding protein [Lachnoanaerobaculum umeaense]|uniref:ABC transporter ATP-binding protein n=1 Tax=Lachnoanaerobaculum umeaense TaxID=617123 RepID=A0A385Q1J8_9FIRM|nr:ABC transporter ATP-binding protein [Lachnoanaerobaculum umeaense]AYA99629.1 ABC transporter ATP-binding protein [Lachnoanaerobaculum umeaense]PZW98647.1 cobalt/nickel transport system ATP-binding protein [Lachnoanaerobaculum umeaense]